MDIRKNSLPQWPRGLSRNLAATYIGVSLSMWDKMVAEGRMPQPKRFYGRTIWDRTAVDAAFDILDGDNARNIVSEELYQWSSEPTASHTPEKVSKDPAHPTMTENEGRLWLAAYKEQWKDGVVSRKMSPSERKVLSELSTGQPVLLSQLPSRCRHASVERLVWRGYAIQIEQERGKEAFQITVAGLVAFEALTKEPYLTERPAPHHSLR